MCRAVSHTTVLAVIEAGARTVEEVSEQSRAASACGRCRDNVVRLLAADVYPPAFVGEPDEDVRHAPG